MLCNNGPWCRQVKDKYLMLQTLLRNNGPWRRQVPHWNKNETQVALQPQKEHKQTKEKDMWTLFFKDNLIEVSNEYSSKIQVYLAHEVYEMKTYVNHVVKWLDSLQYTDVRTKKEPNLYMSMK